MEPRSKEQAPTISLGVRIAVFASLSVLTAVLLTLLVLEIQGRSESRTASEEQLRRGWDVAAGRLARDGDVLRRLATTVARDPKFFALLSLRRSERTSTYEQSLERVVREFQGEAGVEIFDVTDDRGATVAASERPAAPEPSRDRSPLIRLALAGRGVLGFRLEGGRLYRVAVVPVLGVGTTPVGTLTLGAPLDDSFAKAVRDATGADLLLLAGEIPAARGARPVARPFVTTLSDAGARSVLETIGAPPRARAPGRPRPRPVSLAKAPALAVDVWLDEPTEGGSARLLLVAPLAIETTLVPVRQTLLSVGAVTAAASLLVGFVLGGRVSRRLRGLRSAAREAGAGNYDVPLPPVATDDVGLLTADFQAMREKQRREIDRLVEVDRMRTDFLSVTAQDLMTPVEEIRRAGKAMAVKNAPALGPEGLRRLRVIRGGADTLSRMVQDLGGACVVLSNASDPAPVPEEEENRASLEVVSMEAAFHPALPSEPPAAPGAPGAAAAGPQEAVDVAALVESVAVELMVAAAERGIEVDMAIEPDLMHPSAAAGPLAVSLRGYGQQAIAMLSPGSSLSFSAWRSPDAIRVRVEGGAAPLEAALPLTQ